MNDGVVRDHVTEIVGSRLVTVGRSANIIMFRFRTIPGTGEIGYFAFHVQCRSG